jgi:hypothetical protein
MCSDIAEKIVIVGASATAVGCISYAFNGDKTSERFAMFGTGITAFGMGLFIVSLKRA